MIRAAVLGADVSKSRSPAIHNAAFRALGVDGRIRRDLRRRAAHFAALVGELRGAAATATSTSPSRTRRPPHALAERARPGGARVGRGEHAALRAAAAPIRGENTDGAGLLAALADLGVAAAGRAWS